MTYLVDVIIPVRHRDEYDICERLSQKTTSNKPNNFNFIVVDYGSEKENALKIEKHCEKLGFNYIHAGKPYSLWNASAARNIGILSSTADYLIFEDVDLKHPHDFYEKINIEIKILLESNEWLFFVIPVTYLTEDGSILAKETFDDEIISFLKSESYKNNSSYIQHHAPASSFLVCKRDTALTIGGYDEAFEGWGFEDSDFWVRLLMKANIDKPRNFFKLDTRNYSQQVNWNGWRSLFRIHADIVSNKGICSYHIWHPISEHRFTHIREKNHKIFLQNCKNYSAKNYSFTPLRKKNHPTDLFLSKNPHSWNEALFKYFDNPIYIDEKNIELSSLEYILEQNNIRHVIFNNPYGNEKRLSIYEKLRSLNIKTYVVERGALPWSIYIDSNGFCAESTSYQEQEWENINISKDNMNATIEYIHNLKTSGSSLEPQASMLGGANLKRKLFGESEFTKILFVALQSPSDTTTNYFCDQVGNYNNFINEVSKLPYILPTGWKVVYKNHPLTLDKFSHPDMTCVDDYHISDILECCDYVCLINSGVGVISSIYGKFTFNFGKAFYQCAGLNKAVSTATELVSHLEKDIIFDTEKSIKFTNYLINHFYSFASWIRAEREHTSVAKLSISLDIEYQKIMIDGTNHTPITKNNAFDLLSSSLFDRYRMDEYVNRQANVTPTSPAKKIDPTPSNVAHRTPTKTMSPNSQKLNGQEQSKFIRKLKKLKRDPYRFFYDALAKKVY